MSTNHLGSSDPVPVPPVGFIEKEPYSLFHQTNLFEVLEYLSNNVSRPYQIWFMYDTLMKTTIGQPMIFLSFESAYRWIKTYLSSPTLDPMVACNLDQYELVCLADLKGLKIIPYPAYLSLNTPPIRFVDVKRDLDSYASDAPIPKGEE